MNPLQHLLDRNQRWAARMRDENPQFFQRLAQQQQPQYLWIGCSDSRVPPNQILDLPPGEIFVHRNVANLVVHTDLNCLSVLQYAVEALQVRHIIVCGHYGCGGVAAALEERELGLIDNWLAHIKDVYCAHRETFEQIASEAERADRLCELNVCEQVANVCRTTIVRNAWRRSQPLSVNGWIYRLTDGHLHDLGCTVTEPAQVPNRYRIR